MVSYERDTLLLFCGIGCMLILASLIGFILKRKYTETNSVIVNLNARINAWWVMVLVIGTAFALGNIAVVILFFLMSGFALREFITITPTNRNDYYALLFA